MRSPARRLLYSFVFSLGTMFAFPAFGALSCNDFLQSSTQMPRPQRGQNLGIFELFRNLKMRVAPSKTLRTFDTVKYESTFNRLKNGDADSLSAFAPQSREEFAALIDVKFLELQISTQTMDPIFRHKVFKLIDNLLNANGADPLPFARKVAETLFRGHFQKTTSFAFLMTHSPAETGSEMLLQHLQAIMVTDVVLQAAGQSVPSMGPYKPDFLSRVSPRIVRENRELVVSAAMFGVSVVQSVTSGQFLMTLSKLNYFKLKANADLIRETLDKEDPLTAFQILDAHFTQTKTEQYLYAVVEKTLNWTFLIYFLAPMVTG